MHTPVEDIVEKLMELPPDRLAEVEDFVDFLLNRAQAKRTARLESSRFPVISVGRWPESMNLRREDMYGDDER